MYLDYDIGDDSYYLFTCAELKAREAEFLGKEKLERILKSGSMEDFFQVLRDSVYSRHISDMESSGSFEGAVLEEYKGMVNYLSERLRPGHMQVKDLLFMEVNIHNLKVIVKSVDSDINMEELFIPLFYSYEEMKDASESENYEVVSEQVSKMLKSLIELAGTLKDTRLLEFEIERIYLEKVLESVRGLKSRMISDYIKHVIDLMNIKNIFRNKYLEENIKFKSFLHENGFLPADFMAGFKDEELDAFIKEMGRTIYADIVTKGAYDLQQEGTFSSFEKKESLFFMDFFEILNYTVSNLEKIFQFFLKKKMELRYLNVIFTGVLFGIDENRIRDKAGV